MTGNSLCASCFHLAFFLFWLGHVAAIQAGADTELSIDERLFTASKIYWLLQSYSFSAKTPSSPEFDNSYQNYLHRILTADSRRQFDLDTVEFVSQLHSGHTLFWDTLLDESNKQSLGFYAVPLDGRWVVQDSILDYLHAGDVISNVDSTSIEEFSLQQGRYISASSTAAQRRNLFLLPYLFPEHFTLTLGDGRRIAVNRANLKIPPEKTEGYWIEKGLTAYVRIPSFFDPALEEGALDYIRQFHHAKTLIVDVRNNPGGIPPERLIAALMDRPYRRWLVSTCKWRTPISEANQEAKNGESDAVFDNFGAVPNGQPNPPCNSELIQSGKRVEPTPGAFRGRLIFLVDGGCISACEDLIEPSKESSRATLVGETTQGSAGLPFIYNFHNGMSIRIAAQRNYFPDGSEFEGIGIKPDVEVHKTIQDLKQGIDPVMNSALELAAKP